MPPDWQRSLTRRLRRWASEKFPCPFPVRVYLRPRSHMQEMQGYWRWSDEAEGGSIALADDLTNQELIYTFLEEWAHARTAYLESFDDDADDPHHHSTFWSELGRITMRFRADW